MAYDIILAIVCMSTESSKKTISSARGEDEDGLLSPARAILMIWDASDNWRENPMGSYPPLVFAKSRRKYFSAYEHYNRSVNIVDEMGR